MHVAIIDYGSGNLHSAAKAFERAARESGSPLAVKVTAEPDMVLTAERIVLPGVGAFADCKQGLARIPGMIDALEEAVQGARQAVSRHLRRASAHGEPRARAWRDAGARLDRRRGESNRARQTPRSRSRIWAGTRSA